MHLRGVHHHFMIELRRRPARAACFWLGFRRQYRAIQDDSPFQSCTFSGNAREGAAAMAASTSRATDPSEFLAAMAGTVLGSLTIPGRPEHVREARSFVAKALGDLHPAIDNVVLLTSELVTNAVTHSKSRRRGGAVTVVIAESDDGVRIEVSDEGSELSAPVVRGEVYASDGHGLFLVQALADQWGYVRDGGGTTVWFWLAAGERPVWPAR
jgi:anti-sigma regulatory factor (Ser/Thr protein kinase)